MVNHGLNMEARRSAPCYISCLLVFLAVSSCQGQFVDFQDYITQWQLSPFSEKLYPFGTHFYDERYIRNGEVSMNWDPSNAIPFLGGHYNQMLVSEGGYIRFSAQGFSFQSAFALPYAGTPNQQDPTVIAAFFAEIHLRFQSADGGGLYVRMLDQTRSAEEDDVQYNIKLNMLEHLGQEVRDNVMGAYDFQPTFGLVVTWANVSLYGCLSNCPNNTFQAVFLTDLQRSFSILNYHNLDWLNSGLVQGCDAATGLGSNCRPAQMGFNAGHGLGFAPIPYSGDSNLLTQLQAVGRFVYDVTGDVPMHGGCLPSQYDQTHWQPAVYPPSGNMLGDYQIHISGLCLNPQTDMVKCRFGSHTAELREGMVIDANRVACHVPFMSEIGPVPVYVEVNDQPSMTAHLVVENPDQSVYRVDLVRESEWYSDNPMQLDMRWEPRDLYWPAGMSMSSNSQELPESLRVRIDLYGLRERSNIESASTAAEMYEMKHLETLSEYQTNSGSYGITLNQPNAISCQGEDCDWLVGMVCVSLDLSTGAASNNMGGMNNTNDTVEELSPMAHGTLWTKPVPLLWYVQQSMDDAHGSSWPQLKCKAWADSEPEDQTWTQDLDVCPCTYQQAYTTSGQFIVGAECGENEPCPMQEAKYCVLQTLPSSQGGASTCCYDTANNLVYAGEKSVAEEIVDRSYSRRRHPLGVAPYNDYRRTPSLAYWFHDKIAMILCCLKSGIESDSCLFLFAPRRPTRSCSTYQETGIAMAYGDPHFRTFDDVTYTFNGAGEFTLMKVQDGADSFHLQARMVQPMDDAGTAFAATIITAVAMQETFAGQTGPKVQVHFTGEQDNVLNDLAVYVDGQYRSLVATTNMLYRFSGSGSNSDRSVTITSAVDNQLNNITVIFDSGVAVNIASSNRRLLYVTAKVPSLYMDKTSGLMGKWNRDRSDDLTSPAGVLTSITETTQNIHQNFGMTWEVSSSESVFTYFGTQSYENFQNQGFQPVYEYDPSMLTGTSITGVSIQSTCGPDDTTPCYYDYAVMQDQGVAAATRQAQEWSYEMQQMSVIVPTCGEISAPHCTKQVTSYLENGVLQIVGAEDGYDMNGHLNYNCRVIGGMLQWDPSPNAKCEAGGGSSNATAIAVTIVVLLLIAVILVLLFVWYRRRNKSPKDEEVKPKAAAPTQQEPQQQRHLSKYPDPYINDGLSQSTSSVGSVVLTEELHSARPPRPKREKRPKPEMNGMQQYVNQAADVPQNQPGAPPSQPQYANIPPADRSTPEPNLPPNVHYQPNPNQGYVNPVMQPESPNRVPPNRYAMPHAPDQYATPGRGVDTSV